jgi:hypothetical protein
MRKIPDTAGMRGFTTQARQSTNATQHHASTNCCRIAGSRQASTSLRQTLTRSTTVRNGPRTADVNSIGALTPRATGACS